MQMEGTAKAPQLRDGVVDGPGMSGASGVCGIKSSASSALNKVDRQGDEGIFCQLTQQIA
jgi:hypothetical protein